MQKEETQEAYKLRCKEIKYKVNEEKGTVTALETVEVPYPISMFDTYQFTAIGVAKVNKEAGEEFNVEIGKKVARAKAEKEAFIEFKKLVLEYRKMISSRLQKIDNTIEKMKDCIEHQKEYLKSF